ncbi:TFIIH subunit TTDA/Tfb5 [Melampsora americana]|nr:TFIIH subunit TTDA/Tfb5 [Melampsora americana]
MVRAVKGVLLTCDPAVKQLILSLNDKPANSISTNGLVPPFIVQDLDETHLLVTQDCIGPLRAEIETEVRMV